jgi:manganese-dependent ADP-ribose/CDP-alcohol diphosphatase
MISRRTFLAGGAAALPVFIRAAEKPSLHLGLIADPQYADIPPIATRHYRESIKKLTEAVAHFNAQELDFCVNVGDTIDKEWKSFDEILKPLEKLRHKFYHLLGNHDFDLPDGLKAKAPKRLGMEQRYYSVTQNGFCLVMLDTNDVSVYAQAAAAKETTEAMRVLNAFARSGVAHAQPWNGAVGLAQMKWFEDTCKKAAEAKQKVIAFAHHPIYPFPHNHNAWNSDALLQLISRNRNVVAWINGHNHQGNFAVVDDVPFFTLKGMVETPDTNAYATARILPDRIVISGKGREPDNEVRFRNA